MTTRARRTQVPLWTTTSTNTDAAAAAAAPVVLGPDERARLERVAAVLRARRRERGAGAVGRGGGGGGGVRYLSEEPAEGDVHPPFPLHEEWSPMPPRPAESHQPWDRGDALVFRPPETYLLDPQQGRLRRVDYTIPALPTDAPPPVVSRRKYEGEALLGSYRVIVPRAAYRSIRAPPPPTPTTTRGFAGGDEEGETGAGGSSTVNLEALAEQERARAAVAAAVAAFPSLPSGAEQEAATSVLWEGAAGRGGGMRRPSVRTDSVSIYALR